MQRKKKQEAEAARAPQGLAPPAPDPRHPEAVLDTVPRAAAFGHLPSTSCGLTSSSPSPGRGDELKHFFERLAEHVGNPERDLERRRVLASLDRVDRLPRDTDLVGELLLRHLAVVEPQGPDVVADARPRLRHVQIPRR